MKSVKILVSGILLAVLAWRTDWQQVGQVFRDLHLGWWLAALGVYGIAQLVSSIRWQMFARPLGFHQPTGHYLGYYFIGMFFNLMLPTSVGGDVIRAWYLDGGSGRRLPAFVSVFVERCSGLVVLLILAGAGVLLSPFQLPGWVSCSVWTSLAGLVLGGTGLWIYCSKPSNSGRWPVVQSAISNLQSAMVNRPGLLISTTVLSLVVQAANIVLVWLVGLAINAPVPASYYWIVVPMVALMQVVLPSLNGHGVREGGLILFLAEVGVAEGTALSLGLLWFAVMATASLAGGLVYLFGKFPRPEVSNEHDEPVHCDPDQGRARQPAAAA